MAQAGGRPPLNNRTRTVILTFCFPEDLADQLRELCADLGKARSPFIRKAVIRAMRKQQKLNQLREAHTA